MKKKFEQDHDIKWLWIFPSRWKPKQMFKDVWNPNETRVFPPKQFGIGWGLNFHALWRRLKK